MNEYGETSLLHSSPGRKHISLNTLGLPFAQLLAIGEAVKNAIRDRTHAPADLYMDRSFYHSLRFQWGKFDKNTRSKYAYVAPLGGSEGHYFAEKYETIAGNLEARATSPILMLSLRACDKLVGSPLES